MRDKNEIEIKLGDVCFYSERPHSNVADSLVHIYGQPGQHLRVGHIISTMYGVNYEYRPSSQHHDIELDCYSWDILNRSTNSCPGLQVIPNLTIEEATVEYATENFPLDRK